LIDRIDRCLFSNPFTPTLSLDQKEKSVMSPSETEAVELVESEPAETHLTMAQEFLDQGFIASCKLWLGWLVRLYPDTPSACEARRMLESISRGGPAPA
jgi:hypothetical protein